MLDCRAARALLDQGVAPGSRPPERAQLGFHLAQCPDCRSYRAALQNQFLANMLGHAAASASAPMPPAAAHVPRRARLTIATALWYASLGLFGVIGVVVLVVVGGQIRSLLTIHRNLQAMIVTATPRAGLPVVVAAERTADAVAVATTVLPTSMPSAPPLPSHTPTRTPLPTIVPTPTLLPPSPTPRPPPPGDALNVLLLGSDRRPGEGDPSRTDSIIVLRLDPARQRVALLSLPRDLLASIPGYGYSRVNAAYAYGGADLARQTVSQLLGIDIQYTITIDFEGFIKAIDAIGGVPVEIDKELYDPQFPTMDYGYTVAHFVPGTFQLDGAAALMYSRVRHPDSDFMRLRRQQAVLVGVLNQLRNAGSLGQLDTLAAVTTALRDDVRTDMPEDRMVGLAWALQSVAPAQIEHYFVTPDMVTFGSGSDQWIEVPVAGTLEQLANQLMGR